MNHTSPPPQPFTEVSGLREEFARALGIHPTPSNEEISTALQKAVRVIHDLKQQQVLDEENTEVLLTALLTMYVSAVAAKFAEDLTSNKQSAPLRRWLDSALSR
jgi:hypothetical protein